MRVFVTGGTGFIGRRVVEKLIGEGHHLLLLCRGRSYYFSKLKNTKIVKGDLSNINKWKGFVKKFKPDAVIHLAWEGIPDYGFRMSKKNFINGLDLLSMLKETSCKKILVTGSCWEYGQSFGRLDEDMAVSPLNAFSASKNALNWLGGEIAKEAGIKFVWARVFYVYGPGQKNSSLIPYLISSFKSGNRLKLNNPHGGNDFIYVEDAAGALVALLSNGRAGVYNIGSGKITSIADVVNEVYGKKIIKKPNKIKGFYADISKIKKETNWFPRTSIKKGIEKTIEVF